MNNVKILTSPECDRRHGDEDNSRKVKRVALIAANEAVADVAAIPVLLSMPYGSTRRQCDERGGDEQRATSGELGADRGPAGLADGHVQEEAARQQQAAATGGRS